MRQHLGQLLAQRAALSPQREALVDGGERWTYAEFDARCRRLAAHLVAQGVKEGDRVAILARNGEFLANAVFATARIGAVAVALNWRLQAAELEYIVSDSDPLAVLYEEAFAGLMDPILAERETPVRLCHGPGEADYVDALGATLAGAPDALGPGGSAPAVIMYTSGTSGRPKGAVLSHDALVWAALSNSNTLAWNQDHRFLLIAPMFHIGGLSPLITNVLKGCTTLFLPDFDPLKVWRTVAEERITSLMCVPLMLQALLAVAGKAPVDASSLVWVTCGASAVPAPLIEAGMGMGIVVQQVYGVTEFCGAVSFWTPDMGLGKAHTQGKTALFAQIKIVDPATGQELPVGQDGEIWCRGPMVFSGYWRNEPATADAFEDGWYRTGDIGHLDEHGFIQVVDRLKDMLISGGENIYPAELEAVIATLPGVAEVAVAGRADAQWGEVPVAFVVRRPDSGINEADIVRVCRDRLAAYKCVRAVVFLDGLPRSAVGKVLKHQLQAVGQGSPE